MIIISGLSGAGKSVALAALEDCGYFCIDNLPCFLMNEFFDNFNGVSQGKYAISIDVRNLKDPEYIVKKIFEIKQKKILFLRASIEAIFRRFQETRRRHPLLREGLSLEEAIREEELFLQPIASIADVIIDTTDLSVHEFRKKVFKIFCYKNRNIYVTLISFGFKYGIPCSSDFLFDARVLPNPHWEPELCQLTGRDEKVASYLRQFRETDQLVKDIFYLLKKWLPKLRDQNKNTVTIAIGCTGGRHRSVYVVEALASLLRGHSEYQIGVQHRDLNK